MSEVSVFVEVSEEVLVAISSSLLEEFKTIIVVTVAITTDSGAWEDTSYGAGYFFHNDATRNHT